MGEEYMHCLFMGTVMKATAETTRNGQMPENLGG